MARPVSVTVGGLGTADNDGITTTQTPAFAGGQYLQINGALTTFGATANNICLSQTPAGAGALILNGTLASSVPTGVAVAYLGIPSRIYFTCAADESDVTFAIVGTTFTASGGPIAVTETLVGSNANKVTSVNEYFTITSITISAAASGAITVGRSGYAILDTARRVLITSCGDDSDITFTVTGTDWAGAALTETFAGGNATTASSTVSFKTVTSVKTSAAASGTVIVGTNGVADSPWILFDSYAALSEISGQTVVSGTVNYTVRQTLDNHTSLNNEAIYGRPDLVTWFDHPDTAVVAATVSKQFQYTAQPAFAKVVLNSGTGSVTMTVIQAGLFSR